MIIAFGYKKQVGKDTGFKILSEEFPQYTFKRIAFADPLKIDLWESLYKKHGFPIDIFNNPETKPLLRPMAKSHGNFMRDYVDKDHWVKKALEQIIDPKIIYGITDFRFSNEANQIKNKGGDLLKVIRDEVDDNDQDISETQLDSYNDFDYIIENNGTLEEYREKVIEIFKDILSRTVYNINDAN